MDAETVVLRLREAGSTLLCLPAHRWGPAGFSRVWPDMAHEAIEAVISRRLRIRPPPPSATMITWMDEALGWVGLIPENRRAVRRTILLRALVDPVTDRHLYSWRRIGGVLRCSHTAAKLWHGEGVEMIVEEVGQRAAFPSVSGLVGHPDPHTPTSFCHLSERGLDATRRKAPA